MHSEKNRLPISERLPKPLVFLYRLLRDFPKGIISIISFLFKFNPRISFYKRLYIVKKLYIISYAVNCPHTNYEIITYIKAVLSIPKNTPGYIIEVGCYKGGSTAKFSIASKIADRKLAVFDSFEGLPANNEPTVKNWFGLSLRLQPGFYCGRIDEVKKMSVSSGK